MASSNADLAIAQRPCETATGDWEKQPTNPLEMPKILEELFKRCPVDTLKNCRLVNTTWNDRAVPVLRVKARRINITQIATMKSFLETASQCHNFPFAKFGVDILRMRSDWSLDIFLQLIAPWVTDLHLTLENSVDYKFDSEIYYKLKYPLLQKLHLGIFPMICLRNEDINSAQEKSENRRRFLHHILQNTPNLKGLALLDPISTEFGSEHSDLTFLLDLLEKRDNSKLGSLNIQSSSTGNGHLKKLTSMKLNLHSVYFHFFIIQKCVVDETLLKEFLESQSSTLEVLVITGLMKATTGGTILFPKMNHLKAITLNNIFHRCTFPNLNFQKLLPNLAIVSLSNFENDGWVEFVRQPGVPPVESVHALKLTGNIIDNGNVHYILKMFPNLIVLEIPAKEGLANTIYELAKNVKILALGTNGRENIDEFLTGFTPEECKELQSLSHHLLEKISVDKKSQDGVNLDIKSLKKLTFLKLEPNSSTLTLAQGNEKKVEMTKVSVKLALSRMPQLKFIDLGQRRQEIFEELDYWAELNERFQVVSTTSIDQQVYLVDGI